jgi:hypothetical protein
MTRTHFNRRATGAVLAALALGATAPAAGARPIDSNSANSPVPPGAFILQEKKVSAAQTQRVAPATASHNTGGISDWEYAAIGTGAAAVALIGVGGTLTTSRRRQVRRTARQSIAA